MTDSPNKRIFLSPPHMGGKEMGCIEEAFASNYIAPLGPMVDRFEQIFSEYLDIPHCVALSSGTAAMHLILRHLLQVSGFRCQVSERGDHRPLIFASTLTFIGSVSPATFEGCDISFIDCDRESWNMDVGLLEQALKDAEKEGRIPIAVIPTDLYGQCCDLPKIISICNRYDVPVICDSAESLGARYYVADGESVNQSSVNREENTSESVNQYDGQTVKRKNCEGDGKDVASTDSPTHRLTDSPTHRNAGYGAYASVYSFNGNKIITTSGGGMLATEDAALAEHARKLATQARDDAPHYEHSEIGYNYRMSNVVAAIGVGQMEVLDDRVKRKREIFAAYESLLGDLPGITFMPEPSYSKHNRWLTVILVDESTCGTTPQAVRLALETENIEARPLWKPMHMQPCFQHGGAYARDHEVRAVGGEVAEELFTRGLCLPSGTAMTDSDIERVVGIVRGVVKCE